MADTPEGFIAQMGIKYNDQDLSRRILTSALGKRIILKIKTLEDEIIN